MSQTASTPLALPSSLNYDNARHWAAQISANASDGARLDAGAVTDFDTSALAVLLHAKRSGYTLSNLPSPLIALARVYAVDELLAP